MKKISIILLLGLAPFFASAAGFYYGGWIPYWNKTMGTQDILGHLKSPLAEVSPFSYEVRRDGALKDKMNLDEAPWPDFLSIAKSSKIKITPSVALLDGDEIHYLLSNAKRRQAHEDIIAAMVLSQNFDGIDIDYEAKKSTDKNYFSTFIKGLAQRLHPKKKILSCTIESRTPLDSLYTAGNIPKKVERSNDLSVLNKYCDQIRVMAYDQGFVDLKLNK
ncbi:MAG: glycosyl hydrolase family 18 protein, partial [Candidatus Parcubacteria bacterium]|nr:glycosyl hydrolase family 18 protein [Candidatus Parcubacteria bacterium]